jgi:hypothetical protein
MLQDENVVLTLRAKLYLLVPKAVKKSASSEDKVEVSRETSDDKEKGGGGEEEKPKTEEKEVRGAIGQNEWRECGVGNIRLLVRKVGSGGRLVMRREKTEALILNVNIVTVNPSQVGDKMINFSCIAQMADQTQPAPATYLLKTKQKEEVCVLFA